MFLAGYIALTWGEKNLLKVFYIGISAPAIILSAANNITHEKHVPEIPAEIIPSSPHSFNHHRGNQEGDGNWFLLKTKRVYASDTEDRVLVAQESLGSLELILDLEGRETRNIIRETTILLKNPETGKAVAKIKPEASHINISYISGIYDVAIDTPGYNSIPESSRVEIKRGETAKAEFRLSPVEKDYKYHIQQFFLGTKKRFELK